MPELNPAAEEALRLAELEGLRKPPEPIRYEVAVRAEQDKVTVTVTARRGGIAATYTNERRTGPHDGAGVTRIIVAQTCSLAARRVTDAELGIADLTLEG